MENKHNGGLLMKHCLLLTTMICSLSFWVLACGEAPEQAAAPAVKTAETEARPAMVDGAAKETPVAAAVEAVKSEQPASETPETPAVAGAPVMEAADAAGVMEMKNTTAFASHKKGIVLFSHDRHAAAKPEGYSIACGDCHHDKAGKPLALKQGDPVQKCMECHPKTGVPKKPEGLSKTDWDAMQLEYYYGAIHANCMGCHKAGGAGPVKCADCHPKQGN